MAQRRPITEHPAFAPLVAMWFAALCGLGVAVLPAGLIERALTGIGGGALVPLTFASRVGLSVGAALLGALVGLAIARRLALRSHPDPRPLFEEAEAVADEADLVARVRRPLRVREELAEGLQDDDANNDAAHPDLAVGDGEGAPPSVADTGDATVMILGPQPAHPPQPAPDLEGLLAQFDRALDAFRTDDTTEAKAGEARPDPVHAFVARQTGTPAPGHVLSRLGIAMPDHQAELRAALDKLAKAQRRDEE